MIELIGAGMIFRFSYLELFLMKMDGRDGWLVLRPGFEPGSAAFSFF